MSNHKFSKKEQDAYREELASAMEDAAQFTTEYFEALKAALPNATVAQLRDAGIEAIQMSLNAFGPQAAELACELFETLCERQGIDVSSKLYQTIEQGLLDKKVRYFAQNLVNDDEANFRQQLASLTRYYVFREANSNMLRNCWKNNVKYARVPSGIETCGFCFMLSTRGFDYDSRWSAGGDGNSFHVNCDCIIVPGLKNDDIDGYSPEFLKQEMIRMQQSYGVDFSERGDQKKISYILKSRQYAQGLIVDANLIDNRVTSMLKALESNSAKLTGLDFRIKSEPSLERKIYGDSKSSNAAPKDVSFGINDVLRYTYIVDNDSFAEDYFTIMDSLEEQGCRPVKIKNTLKDKQAIYRGVNTVISTGNGENFELQFHTEESFDVKQNQNHSRYELFRLSATPESEKEELARQMVENSSAIKTPSGVEKIGGVG